MEARIAQLIDKYFHTPVNRTTPLGGGFYGRVFLAEIDVFPYKVVVKLYLFPGIAEKEALQIRTLSRYALVKMPGIYYTDTEATDGNDAVIMEYINGINTGNIRSFPPDSIKQISGEIVANLFSYHSTVNPEGFGQLNSVKHFNDWRDYYYPISENILKKAEILSRSGILSPQVTEIMAKAVKMFGRVFYLPITEARLIHGDYNTWNIMLTEDMSHVKAVIDPFNCCWADSEFDLYQLDNANGKSLDLLNIYTQKHGLSENFKAKREFYELFTELNHYYDADVAIGGSGIHNQALALEQSLNVL